MLNEIKYKEKYKIEDGKIYAVVEEINSKRKLNGCEVRKELARKIQEQKTKKEQLEKDLADLTHELTEDLKLDSQLAGLGYCDISAPVYKRLDGIIQKDSNGEYIITGTTHLSTCAHKQEV